MGMWELDTAFFRWVPTNLQQKYLTREDIFQHLEHSFLGTLKNWTKVETTAAGGPVPFLFIYGLQRNVEREDDPADGHGHSSSHRQKLDSLGYSRF